MFYQSIRHGFGFSPWVFVYRLSMIIPLYLWSTYHVIQMLLFRTHLTCHQAFFFSPKKTRTPDCRLEPTRLSWQNYQIVIIIILHKTEFTTFSISFSFSFITVFLHFYLLHFFVCLQHANLGVLTTLRIGHDNTGEKKPIHLQSFIDLQCCVKCDFNV